MEKMWQGAINKGAEAGIGTMIVVIATLIIAVTVAGVLIKVTNVVEQQAQKTGEQARREVCTGLNFIAINGDRKENSNVSRVTNDTIQVIEIKVELMPGSEAIDFNDLMIQISDGNITNDLVFDTSGNVTNANDTRFVATALRDTDNTFTNDYIMNDGDLVKIMISTDSETNLNIATQTEVTIRLIPKHGLVRLIKFVTPSVYTSRYVDLY